MTEEEALTLLRSAKRGLKPHKRTKISIKGQTFSFGYFSDAHIGHQKFHPELWDKMVLYFRQLKPDFICDVGDHLEGMSGRPGHVFELSHIGFRQQFEYAVKLFKKLGNVPVYGIDGNHDEWYFRRGDMGIVVGDELARVLPNYHNLGQDEGNLVVKGVKIRLFHANDGTAYAHSYKIQKYIESLSGGEKPDIVLSGHYHKYLKTFIRNVYGFECGTLCGQTGWMRGKKIAAHMCFGFITVTVSKGKLIDLTDKHVPHFEQGD
jgi:predicted phosphodiesterase